MTNKLFGFGLILTIILLVVSSWLLIHVLAIFGLFLAFAYPLWWLFAPQQTVCLTCRAQKEGGKCPLCRKKIEKGEGMSPSNLTSAVLNGGVILLFSLISIGVVYGESKVLARLGFPATPKTASFMIPSEGQYRLGEIFPMKVQLGNMESSINAIQADIGFDPEKLEVIDISTDESFASVFIQKEINNEGGWSRLTGGLPNPGYTGSNGIFGTVYFRSKKPGLVNIKFLSSSMVLANDGRGTNILKDLPSVSYLILPDKISKDEEQEQQLLISKANVLGKTSVNIEQLIFFEEKSVLGIQTSKEIEEEKQTEIEKLLLSGLEKIDTFILSQYSRILN